MTIGDLELELPNWSLRELLGAGCLVLALLSFVPSLAGGSIVCAVLCGLCYCHQAAVSSGAKAVMASVQKQSQENGEGDKQGFMGFGLEAEYGPQPENEE